MMKHAVKCTLVAVLSGLVATPSLAAGNGGSSTATANSTVTIIRPITVSNPGPSTLQFGTVVAPPSGTGTATVDPSTGAISYAGLDHAPSAATGRADFKVDGEAGIQFSLSVPTTVSMTAAGGTPIVVTTTTNVTGGTGVTLQTLGGVFPAAGTTLDVWVGGTITIPSGQASGVYTGTISVTASYN